MYYMTCGPLSAAVELLLLLLQAAPTFVSAQLLIAAADLVICCCCSRLPSCSFCCRLRAALAAPLQGLPLAALLLLQILGRTIVCSSLLPLPWLELENAPLALARQQLSLLGRTCLTRPSQDRTAWQHS